MPWWGNVLYALGTVLAVVVTWWETRRLTTGDAYREGRRDGWNEAVDAIRRPDPRRTAREETER